MKIIEHFPIPDVQEFCMEIPEDAEYCGIVVGTNGPGITLPDGSTKQTFVPMLSVLHNPSSKQMPRRFCIGLPGIFIPEKSTFIGLFNIDNNINYLFEIESPKMESGNDNGNGKYQSH